MQSKYVLKHINNQNKISAVYLTKSLSITMLHAVNANASLSKEFRILFEYIIHIFMQNILFVVISRKAISE